MEVNYSNKEVVDSVKLNGVDATARNIKEKNDLNCSYKTVLGSVTRCFQRFKHLSKSKGRVKGKENLDRFLNENFRKTFEYGSCEKSVSASRSEPFSSEDDPSMVAEVYKSVAEKLSVELKQTRHEMDIMEQELNLAVTEKDELNEHMDLNAGLIDSQKKKLKRTANREVYWREKCLKLDEVENDETEINTLKSKLNELKEQLKTKDTELKTMKDLIDELNVENYDLKNKETMHLFDPDKNCYISELHACVYDLLDCHVSCENVSNVIQCVLKLCNKTANKLPSVSTINNWSIERALITRKQIAESCENINTTLHTDEASKYGSKWGAFATRDSTGNYLLLGLRDMATKSSHDTMDTFKEILRDIDASCDNETGSANKILVHIKNTMSDRAATETKFNDLLKEYRDTLLPDVIENYNTLSAESQLAISSMNTFFCGLHTLVHMADVSQQAIYDIEKAHFDGTVPIHNSSYTKSNQSGTVRLIMTACKSFARRGDQKSGCHGAFVTFVTDFLKSNKLLGLPLQPLKGNRFNILFSNAGHVYFLRSKMKEYLEKTSTLNSLLQSVLHDLQVPFFLAGCKALGLVSKLVTTPLWNVIENKNVSINLMNQKYLRLLLYLDEVLANLEDFIKGELLLYDDVPVKKDIVFNTLVEPSDIDELVVVILSVVVPALSKLIRRQYGDHLPGGQHEHVNPEDTISVDKHNKYPERVFSYVDHLLSSKPNIKTLAIEAQVAFSLNKTSEWLQSKDNQTEIIEQCRSEVSVERKRFKQRESVILAKRIEKQEEDFRKKQELERKRIERLEKETTDMLYYGLWQTKEQMESELSKISSKTEKEEALKVQLRFRKDVFKQVCDKDNVYAFSKLINGKRVNLSVEELKLNVLCLIEHSYKTPPPEQPHILVGKKVEHKWIEDNIPKWYKGTVISQVSMRQ